MSTTLADLRNLTRDYCGQYSTGTLRDEITDRAINRSIERIKRNIATPADEAIYTFWYTQDKLFYNLPSTFMEGLFVQFNNKNANTPTNDWEYFDYPHVLQGAGGERHRRWSFTHINGRKQLVLVGNNSFQGRSLLTMEDTTDVAVGGDFSSLTLDSIVKVQGTNALAFDVTNSSGTGTITFSNLDIDLTELFNRRGFLKAWFYMTDSDIDSVSIKVQSSPGNSYTIVATLNDDGIDFIENEWQKIAWHTDDKVATGTPDLSSITTIEISFDLGATLTSAVDFRIDNLFTAYGEKLDLVYYTNKKGTSSGGDELSELVAANDTLYFSGNYDEYSDLIAQQAAIILWPQLRGDKEAFILLKTEFKENMRSFTKSYPRKRRQGQFRHSLKR